MIGTMVKRVGAPAVESLSRGRVSADEHDAFVSHRQSVDEGGATAREQVARSCCPRWEMCARGSGRGFARVCGIRIINVRALWECLKATEER